MDRPTPRGEGPLASARALGASIMALLGARAELADIELQEETLRRKHLVVLGFAAAVFLIAALMVLAVLVVVAFWDSYRLAAIGAMAVAYSGIGAWTYWRFHVLLRDSPPPFSATLAEFRRDLDMIRGKDE